MEYKSGSPTLKKSWNVRNDRRKSIKRSLQECVRENVNYVHIADKSSFYWVHQYQKHSKYASNKQTNDVNAKQCILAVVAKHLRVLPTDVIFRKTTMLNERRKIDDCLREVLLK